MKNIFRITAILNLLLVVISVICAIMASITKDGDIFVGSVLTILVSIFPTTLMLVLCHDFEEAKPIQSQPPNDITREEIFRMLQDANIPVSQDKYGCIYVNNHLTLGLNRAYLEVELFGRGNVGTSFHDIPVSKVTRERIEKFIADYTLAMDKEC